MHLTMVKHNQKYDKSLSHVQRWIIKHGVENISISILEVVLPDELDAREEYWITQFDNLTNIRTGGMQARGWRMPEGFGEARSGEKNPMWGKDRKELMDYARSFQGPVTAETRGKQSEAHRGKTHTDEVRKKISDANKDWWTDEKREAFGRARSGESHPLYGVGHTDEARRKISMSKTKLTEDDIRKVRKMRDSGMMYKDIVAAFPPGVLNESTAIKIVKRQRFGWIED